MKTTNLTAKTITRRQIVLLLARYSLAISLLPALLFSQPRLGAQNGDPQVIFNSASWDFGSIKEADGQVTNTFSFKNNSTRPIGIGSVSRSCSCTTADYPREKVAPGGTGDIEVYLSPAGSSGTIFRSVEVWSDEGRLISSLTVRADVTPIDSSIEDRYSVALSDKVVCDRAAISFGYIFSGDSLTKFIRIANLTNRMVSLRVSREGQEAAANNGEAVEDGDGSAQKPDAANDREAAANSATANDKGAAANGAAANDGKGAEGLAIEVKCPETLGPREENVIAFTCKMPQSDIRYGSFTENFQVIVNGEKGLRPLMVSVICLGARQQGQTQTRGQMQPQEQMQPQGQMQPRDQMQAQTATAAPAAGDPQPYSLWSSPSFGKLHKMLLSPGYSGEIVIGNSGKTDLKILEIQSEASTNLKKGEVLRPGMKKAVRAYSEKKAFSVEIFTSDPVRPYRELKYEYITN